jgi:hypothetical protein
MGHALVAAAAMARRDTVGVRDALRRALASRWEDESAPQRAAAERVLHAIEHADAGGTTPASAGEGARRR